MRHTRLATALLVSGLFGASAAQPQVLWLEYLGTPADDRAWGAAPTDDGGVYIAGATAGKFGDIDLGVGDAFLLRADSAGGQVWVVQFGTDASDSASELAADDKVVFLAGTTKGSLGAPSAGKEDVFLAQFDSDGNQNWLAQLGSDQAEWSADIVLDGAGGVIVTGRTWGDVGAPNAGAWDSFTARYSASGDRIWLVQLGTSDSDLPYALASDGVGGYFLAGATEGDLGGPNAGGADGFLGRFDSEGQLIWMRQFGTPENDCAHDVVADGKGGVYITGRTSGSLGGPSAGGFDVFLGRYDSDGNQVWMTQYGTDGHDEPWALEALGLNRVAVCGRTTGDLGGQNQGSIDAFVSFFSGAGDARGTAQFGTGGDDELFALASDGDDGVYATGGTGSGFNTYDVILARLSMGCAPDLDENGTLDLFDFLAFVNLFNDEDPTADCTGDGKYDLFDFLCFVNAFNQGC
jgi:hypothetical protein